MRLVAHGRVDVFEAQGVYQLYVDTLQPAGFGDLALRFEALKAQLTKEGLFEPHAQAAAAARGRGPSASRPACRGAVLHDIRKVLARRWPTVRVLVSACQVQGAGAPESIVAALRRLARWTDATTGRARDVVILARGGGSLEDLWAFNEEAVVRAVAAFPVPDRGRRRPRDGRDARRVRGRCPCRDPVGRRGAVPFRLATTSEARLRMLESRLGSAAHARRSWPRARASSTPSGARSTAFRPAAYLAARAGAGRAAARPGDARRRRRASRSTPGRLQPTRRPAAAGAPGPPRARPDRPRSKRRRRSAALSPFATLERGYAIVRDAAGAIVRDAAAAGTLRDPLDVRLAQGAVDVRVERVRDSAHDRADAREDRPRATRSTRGPTSRRCRSTRRSRSSRPVVGRLESGGLALEESIELYERGVALHAHCARLLTSAELRVQRLVDGAGGRLQELDLRPDDDA